jgi:hypothetical protein
VVRVHSGKPKQQPKEKVSMSVKPEVLNCVENAAMIVGTYWERLSRPQKERIGSRYQEAVDAVAMGFKPEGFQPPTFKKGVKAMTTKVKAKAKKPAAKKTVKSKA